MTVADRLAERALVACLVTVTGVGCTSEPSDAGTLRDSGVRLPDSGTAGQDANSGDAPDARDAAAGGADGASEAGAGSADSVWRPLSVIAVVNPLDHGAVGDGQADDLAALTESVSALPAAGGIVYLPPGRSFRKNDLLFLRRAHVKFWAPNRQAEIFQSIGGERRRQSIICQDTSGCGFFGLKLRSDASERFDALEDNQISTDNATDVEVVGCEIDGSAATGIFLYRSQRHYIEGNYIHHTWADHIHHTAGAQTSWCWDNTMFNEAPSNGDDGIACVTYGPDSPRCGDMEWWQNAILGTGWGRGYSVIGGDNIAIHHNWAISVAGAGIIVASEASYNSASSDGIAATNNWIYRCSHRIGHPGILVSGANALAEPLSNLTFTNNVSAATVTGQAYRQEGSFTGVTNTGLSERAADLPAPIPTAADVKIRDTAVLKTRDVSFVGISYQQGLHRIHVRRTTSGSGFEQRFEYVVTGAPAATLEFANERTVVGDYVSERRDVGSRGYALMLTSEPIVLPPSLVGVPFRELRAGDNDGTLGWLWQRLNDGSY